MEPSDLLPIKSIEEHHRLLLRNLEDKKFLAELKDRPLRLRMSQGLFFSSAKKLLLFKTGFITYAYCYRTYGEESRERYKGYAIFSPEVKLAQDPFLLTAIASQVEVFKEGFETRQVRHSLSNIKLYNSLFSDEAEPSYLKLDQRFNCGHIAYVSSLFFESSIYMPENICNFFCPILFNIKKSKFIMPYPRRYLPGE